MMRLPLFSLVALLTFIYTPGCANSNEHEHTGIETPASRDTTGKPVETKKPNTSYKPAFAGQTRIASVVTKTPYKVDKLSDGLKSPWAIISLPGGQLLVTEKKGNAQILSSTGTIIKTVTGFPAVDAGGQGGLLDIALDPAYAQNHMVYWSFSESQGSANLMAVGKGKLDEANGKIVNPVVIFRATPALNSNLHFGSRIVFDKDGNLFVSTGERSIMEGRPQAQLLNSALGKIFKITKEGKPAPGNPFIGKAGVMPEIYAYGIRNAQGLDLHPVTGELWESEFGPRGGDEVNIIRAGKNYGWPVITYGLEYSGKTLGPGLQQQAGMEQPVYYWDPVLSPSGMTFYKGAEIPEWKNNLFIGGLSSMHIARLVINNNKVVGEERLLSTLR